MAQKPPLTTKKLDCTPEFRKMKAFFDLVIQADLRQSGNEGSTGFSYSYRINGPVYGGIYPSNDALRNNRPNFNFTGNPTDNVLNFDLQIMEGDYVIRVFQDNNNNRTLDLRLFNIPRESVDITNYNGRGIPGNFDRHKVTIKEGTRVIVNLNQM